MQEFLSVMFNFHLVYAAPARVVFFLFFYNIIMQRLGLNSV